VDFGLQNEEQTYDDWSRHRLTDGRISEVRAHGRIMTQQSSDIAGGCFQKTVAEEGNPASFREKIQHHSGALRPTPIPNQEVERL
jgi:hypothetical protein